MRALILGVLATTLVSLATTVAASPPSTAATTRYEYAYDPIFAIEDPTTDVLRAEEALSPLLANNRDTFGGYIPSADGNKLIVWVADSTSPQYVEAQSIAATFPGVVDFREGAQSMDALSQQSMSIASLMPGETPNVRSVGISLSSNAISVKVKAENQRVSKETATADEYALGNLSADERYAIQASGASTVIIDAMPEIAFDDARNEDSGSKSGGAYYAWDGTKRCSLGMPMVVSGVAGTYGLTAGHCQLGSSTAYAPGKSTTTYKFGTRYTTSWPGNAYRFSDFQLLSGSSYASNMWSGSTSTTTTTAIKDVYWYARGEGSQYCSSGGRTGSICRYYIVDTEATNWIGTTKVYPTTVLKHRSDRRTNDCSGWLGGDSGGTIYFSHWSGSGIVAAGLVTGSSDCIAGQKWYIASELWGISRWKKVGVPVSGGTIDWGP